MAIDHFAPGADDKRRAEREARRAKFQEEMNAALAADAEKRAQMMAAHEAKHEAARAARTKERGTIAEDLKESRTTLDTLDKLNKKLDL